MYIFVLKCNPSFNKNRVFFLLFHSVFFFSFSPCTADLILCKTSHPNVFLISCTLQLFSTTISTVCYAQFVTVIITLLTCPTSSVWSRGSAKLGDVPQHVIRNKKLTNGTSVNLHDTIIAGQVTYMHGSVVTKIPRGQRLKMLFRGLLKLIVHN